jgi:hypothetical protein
MIPKLEHYSGSWVVSSKITGKVIGEFFNARSLKFFNPKTTVIETAAEYLARLNRELQNEHN